MDWESLAWRVLDRVPEPAVALDAAQRIVVMNAAMEVILDRKRQDCLAKDWATLTAESHTEKEVRWWVDRALRGAVTGGSIPILSRAGRRYQAVVDVASVGAPTDTGLLITLADVRAGPSPGPLPEPKGVEYYEVEAKEGELGPIVSHWPAPEAGHEDGLGRLPCHRFRYERGAPCVDCPVPKARLNGAPAVAAVRSEENADGYHLVSAVRMSESLVRVTVHHIDDRMFSELVRVRVEEMSKHAGLSTRERDVLDYLLMGRTLGDIAKILEISPRTVKFHQSNILHKMGADSRLDLMRILF